MKNFKAISMDFNKEQFDSMKQELIELGCEIDVCEDMDYYSVLVNNCNGVEKSIINLDATGKPGHNRTYIGAFDKEAFLKACGKVEEAKESGWYISTIGNKWMMYVDYENNTTVGFQPDGGWFISKFTGFYNATKATNEQVLQRLTEETEKRGYKEGVSVKSINGGDLKEFVIQNSNIKVTQCTLYYGGVCVMSNGIWADMAPNEIEGIKLDISKAYDLSDLNEFERAQIYKAINGDWNVTQERFSKPDNDLIIFRNSGSWNWYDMNWVEVSRGLSLTNARELFEKNVDEIKVIDPVNVSELIELKKEKTSLLKSRNRYKQLYHQEKDRVNGLVKDTSALAIENTKLQKGAVFLIQEVKSFEHELSELKRVKDELYRIGCQLGSENDKLKKDIKQTNILFWTVLSISIAYVIFTLC